MEKYIILNNKGDGFDNYSKKEVIDYAKELAYGDSKYRHSIITFDKAVKILKEMGFTVKKM